MSGSTPIYGSVQKPYPEQPYYSRTKEVHWTGGRIVIVKMPGYVYLDTIDPTSEQLAKPYAGSGNYAIGDVIPPADYKDYLEFQTFDRDGNNYYLELVTVVADSGLSPPYNRTPLLAYQANGFYINNGSQESPASWITHQDVPAGFYVLTYEGGIEQPYHNGYRLAGTAYGSPSSYLGAGNCYATQCFYYDQAYRETFLVKLTPVPAANPPPDTVAVKTVGIYQGSGPALPGLGTAIVELKCYPASVILRIGADGALVAQTTDTPPNDAVPIWQATVTALEYYRPEVVELGRFDQAGLTTP